MSFDHKPPDIFGRPFDVEYSVVTDVVGNATTAGTNIMAVEVHNADHVNTDLKWVQRGGAYAQALLVAAELGALSAVRHGWAVLAIILCSFFDEEWPSDCFQR